MTKRNKYLWLFLALLLSACFKPREVEPPAVSSSDWVSPTDYQILLTNLQLSISQKNVPNYIRCFSQDSLQFVPATVVYTGSELVWDNWSLQDEQTWLENTIAALSVQTGNFLELQEQNLQTFGTDSVRYNGIYELTVNHSDTTLTTRFEGQLEFLCRINNFNEWEIRRWTDFETSEDSSWSRLKLSYVQ